MKETSKVNLVFVIFSIIPHHPTFSPFQIVRKTLLEERVSRLKSEKSWLQTFTAALVIFITIIIILIIFTGALVIIIIIFVIKIIFAAALAIIIVCIKVLKRAIFAAVLVLIIICIKVLKRDLEGGKLVPKNPSSYCEALLFQP